MSGFFWLLVLLLVAGTSKAESYHLYPGWPPGPEAGSVVRESDGVLVSPDDPGYSAWVNVGNVAGLAPALAPSSEAQRRLTQGISLTSTLTPSLNGIYAVDRNTQVSVQAISLYISVNGRFPSGLSAFPWPDINGTPHFFTTITQFQIFASAVGDYVTSILLDGQQSNPTWPAWNVEIP